MSRSRFLGSLYEAELIRVVNAHLTAAFQFGYFAAGQFFRDTPPGEDMTYLAAKWSYKF